MQRICNSLAKDDFEVLLVGRSLKDSILLKKTNYSQKRLKCFFNKGLSFYVEYNLKLFFFLLFQKVDLICAIDLDTILPCYFVSVFRNKKRVYDAHELFTEQKEIITRPFIHSVWLMIEKFAVPKFKQGYTVNQFIQIEFKKRYGVEYEVIRNLPAKTQPNNSPSSKSFIIYQGAVNEGRCFETLIPAMKKMEIKLIICGKGNFFAQVKKLTEENNVADKVELKGYVSPDELSQLTPHAKFGLTLFESTGLNQYQSLSNRFFDYIMAGIPQVCVDFPEYKKINDEFDIALMVENTEADTLAAAMNNLLNDAVVYERLKQNCLQAREILNWENEETKLKTFWKNICTSLH
ncbi:glycosyl transferases group 1 [mine drainage metagenome]|uniref:Glycosyl transferases group 1 n=1 Tax=mine drainage metagenome TaxID=410659 RepID=A0A1J5SHJ8_9ZZZZ